MLALHEAERAGVKVADQTWQLALNYWTQPGMQHPNGGYGYERGHPPSGSMTCAAIASLIIACDRLSQGDARGRRWPHAMLRQSGLDDEPLDNALEWMANHFSVERNPSAGIGPLRAGGSPNWLLYYLYGLERVGRMSGQRFIGDHDWYREGCEKLLKHQKDTLNGSWVGDGISRERPAGRHVAGPALPLQRPPAGRHRQAQAPAGRDRRLARLGPSSRGRSRT